MIRKITALILSFAMLLVFASCNEGGAGKDGNSSKQSGSSYSEYDELAMDAYDLFNEAIVNMAEESAYDVSVSGEVITSGDGASANVEMQYQFKDNGDSCEYYEQTVMAGLMYTYVYYADGIKYNVNKIGATGTPTVKETAVDYETFMAENGSPVMGILGIDIPYEVFESAEIVEDNGVMTVNILITGITELPDAMKTYAALFGFDAETATDVRYDNTEFTLVYSTDGEFSKLRMKSGVDWTKADGSDGVLDVDLELTVNALGEGVTVNKYTDAE